MKKMSRRGLFGVFGGAAVTAAAPSVKPTPTPDAIARELSEISVDTPLLSGSITWVDTEHDEVIAVTRDHNGLIPWGVNFSPRKR